MLRLRCFDGMMMQLMFTFIVLHGLPCIKQFAKHQKTSL